MKQKQLFLNFIFLSQVACALNAFQGGILGPKQTWANGSLYPTQDKLFETANNVTINSSRIEG